MFARPRPKKSILPPATKKRKTEHTIEEVSFDNSSREEYLTGFHKRKVQRIKRAQEEAEKRAKEERLQIRKELREKRQRDIEEHVQQVNELLRASEASGAIVHDSDSDGSEWGGIEDPVEPEIIDHEDEYIDEDRYTTVRVESVSVTRDGLEKPRLEPLGDKEEVKEEETEDKSKDDSKSKKRERKPKAPKKKFRYESKIERQLDRNKAKAKGAKRRAQRAKK
ncbi:uncharacterized protein DNG_03431 [Cephalotrichum gorgonifer]|uniref:Nucleolar protein 12 n=1 Tax=Cephalotrichum gorgonifer TaxID=2041049 RepID=A0AAE8MWN0_9PEZI|nr:uncharacterized protein DNG_03431 [Cephalotrichum gorgonifer]